MPCKIILWIMGDVNEEHVYFVFLPNRTVALAVLNGQTHFCVASLTMGRPDFETFHSLIMGCYYNNLRRAVRRNSPGNWTLQDVRHDDRQDPELSLDIGITFSLIYFFYTKTFFIFFILKLFYISHTITLQA